MQVKHRSQQDPLSVCALCLPQLAALAEKSLKYVDMRNNSLATVTDPVEIKELTKIQASSGIVMRVVRGP